MGVTEYGLQQEQGPYKTVAQIWEEAAEQGSKYRTLTAKHRYKIVKEAAGESFISKTDLKKVKSLGKGSFGTGRYKLAGPLACWHTCACMHKRENPQNSICTFNSNILLQLMFASTKVIW